MQWDSDRWLNVSPEGPFSGWGPANTQLLWMPGQNSPRTSSTGLGQSARHMIPFFSVMCKMLVKSPCLSISTSGQLAHQGAQQEPFLQPCKILNLISSLICWDLEFVPYLSGFLSSSDSGNTKETSSYVKCQISIPLSGMYLDLLLFKFIFV